MADIAVLAAAVLAATAVAGRWPRQTLYLLLATLPLQFLFVPVSTFHVSPGDLLVIGASMAAGIRAVRGAADTRASLRRHGWAVLVVAGYALGGAITGTLTRTIARLALALAPSVLVVELLRERTHFARAGGALLVAGLSDAAIGIGLHLAGAPPHPTRFSGFGGPNMTAIFLSLAFAITLARYARAPARKVIALPGTVALLALATLSKMAVLALTAATALSVPLVNRRNRIALAAVVLVAVSGALAHPGSRAAIHERLQPAEQNDGVARSSTQLRWWMLVTAWNGFTQHPVAGLGFGRFQAYSLTHPEILGATAGVGFGTHNTYLEVLSEGGLLAFVPFLLHLAGLRRVPRAYKDAVVRGDASTAAVLIAVPVILLCAAVTNMLLHYSFWAVTAFGAAALSCPPGVSSTSPAAASDDHSLRVLS